MSLLGGHSQTVVVCRARERWCALPVEHVVETMRPLPIQPLRGVPEFVLGVSTVRGAAQPVVDLAQLLFGPSKEPVVGGFVALRLASRRVVLAVERVVSVRSLSAHELSQVPPLLAGSEREGVEALGALDGELLVLLSTGFSLPDELWAAAEGAPEA